MPDIQVITSPTPWYKRRFLWAFLVILLLIPLGSYLYKISFGSSKEIKTNNSQTPLTLKSGPAVGYKAQAKSSVVNTVEIKSVDYIAVSENKEKRQKYLFESTVSETGCQTIIYILPADAIIGDIFSFPIAKGQVLAMLGNREIRVGDDYFNLIIQIKNEPMDEGNCSLTKKDPEFFAVD